MLRKTTPSFIAEFPLRTTAADERALDTRLKAARNLYNACLGEALKRLAAMRRSPEFAKASALPKTVTTKRNPLRAAAFKALNIRFSFSASALQKFAQSCRDASWIGDHLGSHDSQTASARAFKAAQQFAFGKRGRPRFKPASRFNSVEGKGDAVITLRTRNDRPIIAWSSLVLPLLLDPRDRDGWQAAALACRTKYVRILRRTIGGKTRWRCQLVQEGRAPLKARHPIGAGTVGLDIGPSTIAWAAYADAGLETFCPGVAPPAAEIRRLQRAMDRSRRATNPDAFNPDGTYRKGAKITVRSKRYRAVAAQKADTERKLAAARKCGHGELANRVLEQGDLIKTERLSYRAFQKTFGRSVARRAPASFVAMLTRKAESAGATLIAFDTRSTKLSQASHDTRTYAKKPLSQRFHVLADGSRVQRDLYSAWLARFVVDDILDFSQCETHWAAAEPLLRRAASRSTQSARGKGSVFDGPRAHVPKGVGADRALKRAGRQGKAACQAKAEAPPPPTPVAENPDKRSLRTPCL